MTNKSAIEKKIITQFMERFFFCILINNLPEELQLKGNTENEFKYVESYPTSWD